MLRSLVQAVLPVRFDPDDAPMMLADRYRLRLGPWRLMFAPGLRVFRASPLFGPCFPGEPADPFKPPDVTR